MPSFSKLLVANRGEIACRVLRTARGMGYHTVAVYSEADSAAPHVQLADEAVCIGPSPARDSYLNVERILSAAHATGADALHPGYGFLSENAAFARACKAAGLVFVGPTPEAIELMGDKARAKARMQEAGVPTVPGFWGADDAAELRTHAERIGYPLLVKATAGGGGRGIRVVREAGALADALASARAEAESAFGDATIMLERLIERGRHIEIQVFADEHGHAVHLGERDCTAQRRRQKVIEEAPSPSIDAALRESMGKASVAAALAVGYRGAGTVEFIVDASGRFYFLEMNTRLQVEHPVTELITGLDLVRLQLLVAAGEPLPLTQADVRFTGHAIEARLYAEDPSNGFAPQTGRVLGFDPAPATSQPGVRIDAGVADGSVISPFYDAMVAKLIAHGSTRGEAIRRLVRALAEAPLFGLRTNARFLQDLLQSDEFARAQVYTALLDEWVEQQRPLLALAMPGDETWSVAFALLAQGARPERLRAACASAADLTLTCQGQTRTARVHAERGLVRVAFPERSLELQLVSVEARELRYRVGEVTKRLRCLPGDALYLAAEGSVFEFREPSAWSSERKLEDPREIRAPLAGTLIALRVAVNDAVREGDVLAVIEAMKMETRILARGDGTVASLHRKVGDQVEANALLIELAPTSKET